MVDILRRNKGMALKLCPLIEYETGNIFMEKSCKKCAPKANHCMQEIPLKIRYFKRVIICKRKGQFMKKLQKFEYLENEKSFLDGIKNIFHIF